MAYRVVAAALVLIQSLHASGDESSTDRKPFGLIGGRYDDTVPTPASVIGHEVGEYPTEHFEMENYIRTLGESSSRVKVIPIGQSYERRGMYLVAISMPEHLERLEEIRSAVERMADPRTLTQQEAERIASSTPAIAWMNFANDGNESAAFEAAIQLMHQLAAGEDDTTLSILRNCLVLVNPAHNPESHQRWVSWYKASVVGSRGTADPNAHEHVGDWRMDTNNNHYQIDLNRDAFALSQVESQVAAEQLHRWNPQVFVDFHGETKNYFFAPYALPVNSNLPPTTRRWAEVIGKANAEAFDRYGWSYFTGEIFDLYYPGYWDSYPALNGAIGMTYETDGGGGKGFEWEREDKTIVTFRDGILHHFTAAMATLYATAEHRRELLTDFYRFRATALKEADQEQIKTIVIDPTTDPEKAARFVALLLRHRIEVQRSTSEFSLNRVRTYLENSFGRKQFPSGSYVIQMAQPQKRLLKTLFEPDPQMEKDFLREVRKTYEYNKRLKDNVPKRYLGFYDVTGWTLAVAWGVDVHLSEDRAVVATEPVGVSSVVNGRVVGGRARFAYVFSYETDAAARLLAQLLKEDFNIAVTAKGFTAAGMNFSRGTLIMRVERNRPELHERIRQLASECRVDVYAIDSGYTEHGVDLGSSEVVELKKPRVAIVTEYPASQTAYGAIWFLFERIIDYGFTAILAEQIKSIDLYRYNVIILPHGDLGGYKSRIGELGLKKLREWVNNGGVLIAVKGAAAYGAAKDIELTTSALVGEESAKQDTVKEEAAEKVEKKVDVTPGAILRVLLDTEYYLTFGYRQDLPVHISSNLLFAPSKKGHTVGAFSKNDLRISGFVFEEMEQRLPDQAYLIDEPTGRGHVILFADDPLFRLYWHSLHRLFLSGVYFAPSF